MTETPWMTREEVAEHLRIDVRTVDRWAETGRLTRHRLEGTRKGTRFRRTEVESLVRPDDQ